MDDGSVGSEGGEVKGSPRVQARIQKLSADKRALSATNAALESRLSQLEAAASAYADLTDQLAAKDAALVTAQSGFDVERAILARGITDADGIEIARLMHGKLGDDGPTMADWLDAGNLPKAVSVYLPTAAPGTPTPTAPPVVSAPTTAPVAANAGATSTPTYDGKADIKAATADLDYYRANRSSFIGADGRLKS